MKKRFFAIAIVIIIIVTAGLVFLFSRGDENNVVPSMVDSIGEYEKIIGNPDDASVIVYEYADYGCGHCADWNNVMNELYEKYDGKLVIVFRSYNIGFKNGLAAAKAAIFKVTGKNTKIYCLRIKPNGFMLTPAASRTFLLNTSIRLLVAKATLKNSNLT